MKRLTPSDQPSASGPAEYFTGRVRLDRAFAMPEPAAAAAVLVTFEPGARTAWHTHPRGQLLMVMSGEGWVQVEGEARQTIRAGDSVWFEPGEKHWHGATDRNAMSHLAFHERENGSSVDWLEQVSDESYLSQGPAG